MQENSMMRILRRINNVRMSELDAAGSGYLPLLCGRSRVGTVPLEAVDQMKLFPDVFKGTFLIFGKMTLFVNIRITDNRPSDRMTCLLVVLSARLWTRQTPLCYYFVLHLSYYLKKLFKSL